MTARNKEVARLAVLKSLTQPGRPDQVDRGGNHTEVYHDVSTQGNAMTGERFMETTCATARVVGESLPANFVPASAEDAAEECSGLTSQSVQTPPSTSLAVRTHPWVPVVSHSTGVLFRRRLWVDTTHTSTSTRPRQCAQLNTTTATNLSESGAGFAQFMRGARLQAERQVPLSRLPNNLYVLWKTLPTTHTP